MDDPVGPDVPLRLADAVEIAFPRGGMTAAGLKNEARRGRLALMRIAGKDFTTLAAIDDMKRRCLVPSTESASDADKQLKREKKERALKRLDDLRNSITD